MMSSTFWRSSRMWRQIGSSCIEGLNSFLWISLSTFWRVLSRSRPPRLASNTLWSASPPRATVLATRAHWPQRNRLLVERAMPPGVLLIHGFTATPAVMGFLKDQFEKAGFVTESPLLAGHG